MQTGQAQPGSGDAAKKKEDPLGLLDLTKKLDLENMKLMIVQLLPKTGG